MKRDEIAKLDLADWPLPEEFLAGLGRIASLWAALDFYLNVCIGKLAGFASREDSTPFILTAHASFPQKLDMLGALCERHSDQEARLKQCNEVVAALRTAQSERNRYLHNCIHWNPEDGRFVMGVGSARGKLKVGADEIDLVDLRRVAVLIDDALAKLHHLVSGRDKRPGWEKDADRG